MYMLLIDGEIKPGKKNDFVDAWRDHVLPLLKQQEGFVDEFLLFEEGTRKACVGLCFWETREQAARYKRVSFPQASAFIKDLLVAAPTVRSLDVEAAETFAIAARRAA